MTTLVVPCYDEADRLDNAAFTAFVASQPGIHLLFVNDGSRDGTRAVLDAIQSAAPDRVDVLHLEHNVGKGEAVRRGLLEALKTETEFVGYWDADLSTPLDACVVFAELLRDRPEIDIVVGSRVLLLGRTIERRAVRHYAGRVFATVASMVLELPIYDTQCGAKLFRVTPRLSSILATPFLTTWVFDVEIIARYGVREPSSRYAPELLKECIYELPLIEWRDKPGSKVRWLDFAKAMVGLARIHRAYIRRAAPGGA